MPVSSQMQFDYVDLAEQIRLFVNAFLRTCYGSIRGFEPREDIEQGEDYVARLRQWRIMKDLIVPIDGEGHAEKPFEIAVPAFRQGVVSQLGQEGHKEWTMPSSDPPQAWFPGPMLLTTKEGHGMPMSASNFAQGKFAGGANYTLDSDHSKQRYGPICTDRIERARWTLMNPSCNRQTQPNTPLETCWQLELRFRIDDNTIHTMYLRVRFDRRLADLQDRLDNPVLNTFMNRRSTTLQNTLNTLFPGSAAVDLHPTADMRADAVFKEIGLHAQIKRFTQYFVQSMYTTKDLKFYGRLPLLLKDYKIDPELLVLLEGNEEKPYRIAVPAFMLPVNVETKWKRQKFCMPHGPSAVAHFPGPALISTHVKPANDKQRDFIRGTWSPRGGEYRVDSGDFTRPDRNPPGNYIVASPVFHATWRLLDTDIYVPPHDSHTQQPPTPNQTRWEVCLTYDTPQGRQRLWFVVAFDKRLASLQKESGNEKLYDMGRKQEYWPRARSKGVEMRW
ncbi:hypothetical protein JCM11641_006216 [Rhodosporidiobolus odoratus]